MERGPRALVTPGPACRGGDRPVLFMPTRTFVLLNTPNLPDPLGQRLSPSLSIRRHLET